MSKLKIHLIPSPYCPDRMSELLAAPSQYEKLRELLSEHFEVWESVRYDDGFPTGQIIKYIKNKASK